MEQRLLHAEEQVRTYRAAVKEAEASKQALEVAKDGVIQDLEAKLEFSSKQVWALKRQTKDDAEREPRERDMAQEHQRLQQELSSLRGMLDEVEAEAAERRRYAEQQAASGGAAAVCGAAGR